MISDGAGVSEPEPEVKQTINNKAISGFPTATKDNLPALPVAKNRPIKTSVSVKIVA